MEAHTLLRARTARTEQINSPRADNGKVTRDRAMTGPWHFELVLQVMRFWCVITRHRCLLQHGLSLFKTILPFSLFSLYDKQLALLPQNNSKVNHLTALRCIFSCCGMKCVLSVVVRCHSHTPVLAAQNREV